MRGVACLAVFVFHAWLYTLPVPRASERDAPMEFVVHELRLGLVVFFVLSGFLLYGPWAAASLCDGRPPGLRAYMRRRAARILPAYYAALLGSVVLLWSLGDEPGVRLPPAEGLPLFAVFAQNQSAETVMKLDPPMWSLAVEVSFYLLLPLVGWLALRIGRTRARQVAVPLALAAIGFAYNAWLADERPGLTFVKSLPTWLPYFACGMLAAVLVAGRTVERRTRVALAAAGGVLILGDAGWHVFMDMTGTAGHTAVLVRDLPAAVGAGLLVGGLASAPSPAPEGDRERMRPPPRAYGPAIRAFAGLGLISYGFYLWHVPVLLWLRAHGMLPLDPLGASAVAGAVSLVLAVASWRLLERPAIAWSKGGFTWRAAG